MSNIPIARELLLDVAKRAPAEQRREIERIVAHYLWRKPIVRRAPDKSTKLTPEIRAQIFQMAETNMHMSEIGHALGINQGRVSEVLNGKR